MSELVAAKLDLLQTRACRYKTERACRYKTEHVATKLVATELNVSIQNRGTCRYKTELLPLHSQALFLYLRMGKVITAGNTSAEATLP